MDMYSQQEKHSQDPLDEICGNCGCTLGSHHGGTRPYRCDYCPRIEGKDYLDGGPGTTFKPTGNYGQDEPEPPIFKEVFCSQCGKGFGPGNHGYSHCEDHKGIKVTSY